MEKESSEKIGNIRSSLWPTKKVLVQRGNKRLLAVGKNQFAVVFDEEEAKPFVFATSNLAEAFEAFENIEK